MKSEMNEALLSSNISMNVSIVIATIGRPSLFNTLDCISNWAKQPGEVIVVLPSGSEFVVPTCGYSFQIRVLLAADIGQVQQRIHGFMHANYDFVLQLDDDLLIDYFSYCELQKVLELHSNATASPIFLNIDSGDCVFKAPTSFRDKFKDILTSWIVGTKYWPAKMGRVSRAGIPYGVNRNFMNSDYLEVDWQSGGCVLHHRDNLVFSNYYPFSGRAGGEDLFHSFILRSKGLKLIMCRNASCKMEVISSFSNIKSVLYEYRVMSEYVKFAKCSITRLRVWVFCALIRVILLQTLRKRVMLGQEGA
jgi:glycosyltransferase involved in cell wall biosynthesis